MTHEVSQLKWTLFGKWDTFKSYFGGKTNVSRPRARIIPVVDSLHFNASFFKSAPWFNKVITPRSQWVWNSVIYMWRINEASCSLKDSSNIWLGSSALSAGFWSDSRKAVCDLQTFICALMDRTFTEITACFSRTLFNWNVWWTKWWSSLKR